MGRLILKGQRIQEIKKLFLSKKQVTNTELCATFNVSIETIRRDLNLLEKEGFIRKVYGGAHLAESSRLPESIEKWDVRMDKNEPVKKHIAIETAKYIPDDCTVFLDSGTSTFEVATCLKDRKNLTVLTNSVRIAQELGMCEQITVYFIGGIIKTDILASSGFFATDFLSYFYHIDCAVISCDGFIPDRGSTELSLELSVLKKNVLDKTDMVIIPVDHSKIGVSGNCLACEVSKINILVTDPLASPQDVETLRKLGVQVIIAPMEPSN
ncbi:MAG: DeoR/GlpR transcriptional regulator [Oscillospiraceae bacterium]|nr:DeoR/GlpR transcriptional regulator [Oscillospiraceae bacterium]